MNVNFASENAKIKYGTKVYRLALSLGRTCPNRDGRCGTGGCIFCAEGSGSFAGNPNESVSEQIEKAKSLVQNKIKNVEKPLYIAYFQSFTSTYVSAEKLRDALLEAVKFEDIVEVSVATRADCLETEILQVLGEISKIKPVTVELGLQTSNEKTAEFINRCCENYKYEEAAKALHELGIKVIMHIILGLPEETAEDVERTVDFACQNCRADGVKLQLLHVLSGTKLEKYYIEGAFETLKLENYCDILVKALKKLPKNCEVYRITGDAPKKLLVAPLWSADKKRVLNFISKRLKEEP